MASHLSQQKELEPQTTAWFHQKEVTFSDMLSLVRDHRWEENYFLNSQFGAEMRKLDPEIREILLDQLSSVA
ncbi:MAG: hypothetical protein NTX88_01800 [Candidatus Atribacteria bacterium]|nr:hypothetical protein [Candidatus Atribacteria bacterium]